MTEHEHAGDPEARIPNDAWVVREVETGNGLVFNVAEQGDPDGRPLLLLHGFPQTHRAFDALAERLVPRGLRLLAPDQRGYSPGARPADAEAYTLTELVGDAANMLDAYGIESADVVGHDWGSAVGWALASVRPERVRTLTAVSVPHPRAMSGALRDASSGQRERSSYMQLFRMPGGKAEDLLLKDDAKRLHVIFEPLPEAVAEPHIRALSDRATLTAALNWYRAPQGELAALPETTVPATYVWSTADPAIGRVAAEGCALYATGPYRFIVLDDVSHWIPEHAPDALADAVIDRLG